MIGRAIMIVVLACGPAFAQDAAPIGPTSVRAKELQAEGVAAYKAKDFATASRRFAAAYAAERYPGFLFSWAQSDRQRGECTSAVDLYQRFLDTSPPSDFAQLARDGIAACGGPAAPVEPPPIEPTPVEPVPVPVIGDDTLEVVDRAPEDPGFQHKLALGLLATGLVAGGTSAYFYLSARGYRDDANRVTLHADVAPLAQRYDDQLLVSRIAFGISLGFVAASAIRFFLTDSPKTDGVALGISPAGDFFVAGAF
ncbi:MAG: tetratricopeptide repeat protein [Kofleriaceae bacterium]